MVESDTRIDERKKKEKNCNKFLNQICEEIAICAFGEKKERKKKN